MNSNHHGAINTSCNRTWGDGIFQHEAWKLRSYGVEICMACLQEVLLKSPGVSSLGEFRRNSISGNSAKTSGWFCCQKPISSKPHYQREQLQRYLEQAADPQNLNVWSSQRPRRMSVERKFKCSIKTASKENQNGKMWKNLLFVKIIKKKICSRHKNQCVDRSENLTKRFFLQLWMIAQGNFYMSVLYFLMLNEVKPLRPQAANCITRRGWS